MTLWPGTYVECRLHSFAFHKHLPCSIPGFDMINHTFSQGTQNRIFRRRVALGYQDGEARSDVRLLAGRVVDLRQARLGIGRSSKLEILGLVNSCFLFFFFFLGGGGGAGGELMPTCLDERVPLAPSVTHKTDLHKPYIQTLNPKP